MRAYRLSKAGSVLITAALLAWALLLGFMLKDITLMHAKYDLLTQLVQLLGIGAFVSGFIMMLVNLLAVWNSRRRWPARLWSIVLAASAGVILWVAFVFKLMSFGVNC